MANFSRLAKFIFIGLSASSFAHCTAGNNPFVDRSAANANNGKPSQDGEGLDGFLGKVVVSADGSTTAHFPKGSYSDAFTATLESIRTRDFDSVLAESESNGEVLVLGAPMELATAVDPSLKAPFRIALRFNSDEDISKALVLVKGATGNFALASDMYGVRTLIDGRREVFFMTDVVGSYSVIMPETAGELPAGFALFPAPSEVARFRAEWTSISTLKLIWTTGAGRPMISWDTAHVPTDCTQYNVISPDVIGNSSTYEIGGLDRRQTYYFRHCNVSPFPGFATLGVEIAFHPSCDDSEVNNVPFANWEGGLDPGDPTFICTAAQLNRINDGETYDGVTPAQRMTRNYVLKADIDLIGVEYNVIGTCGEPFMGAFDGAGHTISNIYIERPTMSCIGLIGSLSAGTVRNVTITVDRISGIDGVGGAIGDIGGQPGVGTTVSGVRVLGAAADGSSTIMGNSNIAGIIGGQLSNAEMDISISNSSAENMNIVGNTYLGGAIGGIFQDTEIDQCYSNVEVIVGDSVAGGLVGRAFGSWIKIGDSYSRSNVNLSNSVTRDIGGFIGMADNPVELARIYVSGNVCDGTCSGATEVGPLCGGTGHLSGGYAASYSSSFYDSDSTKWSTSSVGTAATTIALTTDSNGNGIVDALDNEGWDPAVWELDPVVLKGRRPMLKWQLSDE